MSEHIESKRAGDGVHTVNEKGSDHHSTDTNHTPTHGAPEVVASGASDGVAVDGDAVPVVDQKPRQWLGFYKTKEFWIALVLSQVVSLCLTSTNTFTQLLSTNGASIPAFQTFLTYALLNIIFTPWTLYKYGIKGWGKMVFKEGWKYFIFAFFDVEGNYFIVLGYRYTNILSAQLINFCSIFVVVVVSFLVLGVRYHWTQICGILLCIAGVGVLIGSDHITGSTSTQAPNPVKGDLFVLLAAFCYGFSNIIQEFLVSKKPVYEVLGQLAFWGMIINGVQAAIFDRSSFANAAWSGKVGGYLAGYTLILTLFYMLCPVLFRIASAAFFNIGGLTSAFWGTIIGTAAFGYHVHYLYPIAFVMIILGLFLYFVMSSYLGESRKPWLGKNQEKGVSGLGTARRKVEKELGKSHGESVA